MVVTSVIAVIQSLMAKTLYVPKNLRWKKNVMPELIVK